MRTFGCRSVKLKSAGSGLSPGSGLSRCVFADETQRAASPERLQVTTGPFLDANAGIGDGNPISVRHEVDQYNRMPHSRLPAPSVYVLLRVIGIGVDTNGDDCWPLQFLPQLSQPAGALVAVNGGFFNRINQLPLGALRHQGVWLSGPILNRGVIAWDGKEALRFGRLRLDQELQINGGRRWGLGFLNSGYVQRGLSRYTRAWGPIYRPLSGEEQALLIRDGRVEQRFDRASIRRGVLIPPDADLVVSRGGAPLPASPGDRVTVTMAQRSSPELGDQPNVLGGGPLLMQGGRIVLNGRSEGFSPGFLSLAAPRTVVGQGNGGTWLIALRGAAGSDPTLLETALAMQQLGLRDALNLDGGSSTTVVVSGRTVMNGRGSAPRIHNGLGLLPQ